MIRNARLAAAALLVAALVAPAPAFGWANNKDDYGTHDWILDQALKVLDGRVDGWLDDELARLHSDDPDYTRDPDANEHTYRAEGRVGGAVDRIAYHFDLAQAAYEDHDYDEASIQIGLMSHYVGDLAEPYHTHMGGIPRGDQAKKYEQLVAPLHRDKNDTPAWSSSRRTVNEIDNVRDTAAGTAAYSRTFWKELHDRLTSNGFELSDRVREITGLVFKRAQNDLADLIWSITQGVGAQPAVGEIEMDVKWTGVLAGDENTVYVRAFDVDGHPIEGLRVEVAWPTPTGTQIELLYTLPDGRQKRHRPVGTSPKLVLRHVTATAEVRGGLGGRRGCVDDLAEARQRDLGLQDHRRRCDRRRRPGRHRHEHCPRRAWRPRSESPRHLGLGRRRYDHQDAGLHELQRTGEQQPDHHGGHGERDRDHRQDPGGLDQPIGLDDCPSGRLAGRSRRSPGPGPLALHTRPHRSAQGLGLSGRATAGLCAGAPVRGVDGLRRAPPGRTIGWFWPGTSGPTVRRSQPATRQRRGAHQ